MTKKIIVIFTALLLTASFCACSGGKGKGTQTTAPNGTVNIESQTGNENGTGDETGTGSVNDPTKTAGDPKDYEYADKDDTVYAIVNVTLRTADYEDKGSVVAGTSFKRVGISTSDDEFNGYWSKVVHNEETYYVATKLITTLADPDAGFVAVDKTVVLKTASINIRQLPEMGDNIIGYFSEGDQIKVLAENTESGWYKVEFVKVGETEKSIGYIASDAKYFASETETTDTEAAQ